MCFLFLFLFNFFFRRLQALTAQNGASLSGSSARPFATSATRAPLRSLRCTLMTCTRNIMARRNIKARRRWQAYSRTLESNKDNCDTWSYLLCVCPRE